MKVTRRQIRSIIREELNLSSSELSTHGPLTEAQLQEIAPVILGVGRALVAAAGGAAKGIASVSKNVLPALRKGGKAISDLLKNSPEILDAAVEMLAAAKDKVPDLEGVDLSSPEAILDALKGKAGKVIEDVLQQAEPDLSKGLESEPEHFDDEDVTHEEEDIAKAAAEIKGENMKITKRQLRRIIREAISDTTYGSQRYYTDAAGKRQPVPPGGDLSRQSPAEVRASNVEIPYRDKYFKWVSEKGHRIPYASSVLASYVIDSGIDEEEMRKIAVHMSIEPSDVTRDVDRQLEEKEIQGL